MDREQLLKVMRAEGAEGTVTAMLALSDGERRALAPEVAALVRAHTSWLDDDFQSPDFSIEATVIVVAGLHTASKIPGVLRRLEGSDLSFGEYGQARARARAARVIQVFQARGLAENPRMAAELARRVSNDHRSGRGRWYFELAREILLRSPEPPPVHPAFVQVWLDKHHQVLADVTARPDWSALALGALPNRGTGQLLDEPKLRDTLIRLVVKGLVARADLVDACIGALQATDRKVDLHGLAALHEQIDPSTDEVRERIGQYVSPVAGAPGFIATIAQQRLRALDQAGRLPPGVLGQVTAAVLVRPDKGLFKAQLAWLRAALKTAVGEQLILSTAVGLGHPDPALQKMVLEVLAPYGKGLTDATRQELTVAAGALPPDLRVLAAGLTGAEPFVGPGAVSPGPALRLPAPLPPRALELLPDPEMVAEVISTFFQGWEADRQADFGQTERLLEALVRFSWHDPQQLGKALEPLTTRLSWLPRVVPEPRSEAETDPSGFLEIWPTAGGERITRTLDAVGLCVTSALARAARPVAERHRQELVPGNLPKLDRSDDDEGVGTVLMRRMTEIAAGFWWAPVPVLLATPTTDDGLLEAGELERRLLLVEAAGCLPWPDDLNQAWLRVNPADRGRVIEVVRRVAGTASAERLLALGAAGAQVHLRSWTRQTGDAYHYSYEEPELRTDLTSTLTPVPAPGVPDPWNRLWDLPLPDDSYDHNEPWLTCWPAVLPFERDVTAAHIDRELRYLRRGTAEVIRAHSEVAGPIGPAGLLLYCNAIDRPGAEERAGAAEALITLISRDELDATAFGDLLGRRVADREVRLNRVVGSLRGVGQAGGWPELWQILAAALPHCLPQGDEKPLSGLAELLALAVEAVQSSGPVEPAQVAGAGGMAGAGGGDGGMAAPSQVAGLDEVANRKGTSRLRSGARRLNAALAGARVP